MVVTGGNVIIKSLIIATGCALSFNAIAGTMGSPVAEVYSPWSVIGNLGYTAYQHAYDGIPVGQKAIGDGQTAVGRFAIARDFSSFKNVHFGAEVGVQTGNTMRLGISQESLEELGALLPVQTTIKPILDLLATATFFPLGSKPVFGVVKGGIAYRRMQINDRVTFNDLSEVAFEVQAGIGMNITDRASLSLNYQGILDGRTRYTINTTTFTGDISNIPGQNGILLSLSYVI